MYVFDALSYLLNGDNIKFGTKLFRQIVSILMGEYCAPLVANLVVFCYERDFRVLLLMITNVTSLKH